MDRAVRGNSETWLIAALGSRGTRLLVNAHWRTLPLTSVIETREHDVGLFRVVIDPRNVKRCVWSRRNYGFRSVDVRSRKLNGLWFVIDCSTSCEMFATRREENCC